jgi:hypothetical protein
MQTELSSTVGGGRLRGDAIVEQQRRTLRRRSAPEYLAILPKWPRIYLPLGLFLNVHKIRVDSDNKR